MASSFSLQHQNVKNNVIRKLEMKKILEYMFHLLNISATLFLFWRFSGFTITFQAFWQAYAMLIPLFKNPFYAFLLLNSIIFILYALPNKNNNSSNSVSISTPIINSDQSRKRTTPKTEEFVRLDDYQKPKPESESSSYMENTYTSAPKKECAPMKDILVNPTPKAAGSSDVKNNNNSESVPVVEEDTLVYPTESLVEKQKMCHSSGESSPIFDFEEKTVTAVTEKKCCTSTTNGSGVEERSYRKVQSENYERRVGPGSKPELRRTGTGLKKKKEPAERRLCYVEELSKDEFNRAIEDFIAKQKRKLLEEQIQ